MWTDRRQMPPKHNFWAQQTWFVKLMQLAGMHKIIWQKHTNTQVPLKTQQQNILLPATRHAPSSLTFFEPLTHVIHVCHHTSSEDLPAHMHLVDHFLRKHAYYCHCISNYRLLLLWIKYYNDIHTHTHTKCIDMYFTNVFSYFSFCSWFLKHSAQPLMAWWP